MFQDLEAVIGGDTSKLHDLITNIKGFGEAFMGILDACFKSSLAAASCSDDIQQIESKIIELTRYVVELLKRGDTSKVEDIVDTLNNMTELGKLVIHDCF